MDADQSVPPMSLREQTREQLETELESLNASMRAGSWDRKAACAIQIQVISNEMSRRDQDAQTQTMLRLNDRMVVYAKWMTWLTVAIMVMTVAILGPTLYMALWKA
ncbi:MAG: hypothetical protein ABSG79_12750 [Bryobacteraceae bacterium]